MTLNARAETPTAGGVESRRRVLAARYRSQGYGGGQSAHIHNQGGILTPEEVNAPRVSPTYKRSGRAWSLQIVCEEAWVMGGVEGKEGRMQLTVEEPAFMWMHEGFGAASRAAIFSMRPK